MFQGNLLIFCVILLTDKPTKKTYQQTDTTGKKITSSVKVMIDLLKHGYKGLYSDNPKILKTQRVKQSKSYKYKGS